jgi:hypothetical protein
VGATLLAWRARPQRFARAPSLHECLEGMDAVALRELLRSLAARSEELESLVESLLPEVPAPPAEGWGERVGEAFRRRGVGPGAGDALVDDVERLIADGEAALGPGKPPGARGAARRGAAGGARAGAAARRRRGAPARGGAGGASTRPQRRRAASTTRAIAARRSGASSTS